LRRAAKSIIIKIGPIFSSIFSWSLQKNAGAEQLGERF
jgi:hypothetical protein